MASLANSNVEASLMGDPQAKAALEIARLLGSPFDEMGFCQEERYARVAASSERITAAVQNATRSRYPRIDACCG